MLKDPASIALAALFSFLGISISVYQVRKAPYSINRAPSCTAANTLTIGLWAADIMPPAQLHRAGVSGVVFDVTWMECSHAWISLGVGLSHGTPSWLAAAEVHHQDHIHGPSLCNWLILLPAMA